VGQVLVILTLAGVVFGLIEGPQLGWASPGTLGAFAVAAVALGSFVALELRVREPLIDPRFFASIPFSSAFVAAIFAFGSWSAFLFTNTLYLQEVRRFSPILTGLLFMPAGIAILLMSPLSGHLVGTRGTRLPMTLSGLAIAAAALVLTSTTTGSPVWLIAGVFALFGLGFGLVNAPITNTAVSGMPNNQAGAAAAITSTGRQIGVSLGIAIAGSVTGAAGSGKVGSGFATEAHPLWWLILGAAVGIVALASLSNTGWAGRSSKRIAPLVSEPQGG
jgi:predicted MFS family arabinose efflux permease